MKGLRARGLVPAGIWLFGAAVHAATAPASMNSEQVVARVLDFRHAPPKWQTAIGLSDDPQKSLVDESGALLYHYGKGSSGFGTRIAVEVSPNALRQKQQLHAPRVPIVRTLLAAEGLEIVEEAFADTDSPAPGNSRADWILVHVTNTGAAEQIVRPRIIVETRLNFQFAGRHVLVDGREMIVTSPGMAGLEDESKKSRRVIQLEPLVVAPGKEAEFSLRYGGGPLPNNSIGTGQATLVREHAIAYWEHAELPYGRIEVPDAGIQSLIDASIRNIWQAREIKNGMTAFQVGPTCYRGLWIIDGAFLLEAATMLGAGDQARQGITYELSHQKPDGRIEVLNDFSKENGIVLWTCARHALLTRDKVWLESVWPNLQRIADHIRTLRRQTLHNDTPLDDGLVPPGMPDGGIGGVFPEYSNACWNLLGLRAFIASARWLGKTGEADLWQGEYDDFMAAFRKAAALDLRKDSNGNSYLPVLMGERGSKELPQRGQWGFCHAVYPGGIFERADPLVSGQLAMLAATERQGMVCGTGWDATGIWTYFASFYGHAWLWQGEGNKAADALYAFANHAAPLLVWREEQSLTGAKFRQVGDMPHSWASAEFIRLTVHLLALDRGDELHLFEGLPREWTRPGMTTRLHGIATPFGPLTLSLQVTPDGKSASLHVDPLPDASCRKIIVHCGIWSQRRPETLFELNPLHPKDLVIPIE